MNLFNLIDANYNGYKNYLLEKIGQGKEICLFGQGGVGQATADELLEAGICVKYFIDNNREKKGATYRDIPCILFEDFYENRQNYFVIITMANPEKVVEQLKNNGISEFDVMVSPYKMQFDKSIEQIGWEVLAEKLQKTFEILEDEKSREVFLNIVKSWFKTSYDKTLFESIYESNQYFPEELIKVNDKTSFVDCGASIGDSFEDFLKNTQGGKFEKAFLFELNEETCEELKDNVDKWMPNDARNRVEIINKGVANENKEITYVMSTSSSHIGQEGTKKGKIVRMDDELLDENITMIKMDIEGSETEAILGAAGIIKRNKPAMAVCVYHRLSDIWEVPLMLKKILPEYKIYFRHHTKIQIETVCYAVFCN